MNSERERLKIYGEILDIYKELYNKNIDASRVRELYVEYLKRIVKLGDRTSSYDEDLSGLLYGNCYTYALDVKCPNPFWQKALELDEYGININTGFISNQFHIAEPKSREELIGNLYEDCEELKIRVYDSSKLPSHGGYRILLYADKEDNYNFHFVRENNDGLLSHRTSFMGDVEPLIDLSCVNPKYELVRSLEIVKPVIR